MRFYAGAAGATAAVAAAARAGAAGSIRKVLTITARFNAASALPYRQSRRNAGFTAANRKEGIGNFRCLSLFSGKALRGDRAETVVGFLQPHTYCCFERKFDRCAAEITIKKCLLLLSSCFWHNCKHLLHRLYLTLRLILYSQINQPFFCSYNK